MVCTSHVFLYCGLLYTVVAVRVKMVLHSEQDDSKIEDEEIHTETPWEHNSVKKKSTLLPFIRTRKPYEDRVVIYDDEKSTTEKGVKALHPNDMLFPLIYRQQNINSMFKFGDNWYTWTSDKRADGSMNTVYYVCYEEPKHCDDIGWEHIDTPPKCAFQIDSLTSDDRACINAFGVEPHYCDVADQMKVTDVVRSCGVRIRSLWRFLRRGRRPADVAKPADVNSLICEDEDECFVSLEYRIHRDRITFSLHEPARGQTFKSALKRDVPTDEEVKTTEKPKEQQNRIHIRPKKNEEEHNDHKKMHVRSKIHGADGKGVAKERDDSNYRRTKNKIKVREDISYDISE